MKIARAKYIIRGVDDSGEPDIAEDSILLYDDGLIYDVRPASELREFDSADTEILGSDSSVILPGFVDCHHHIGFTPVQLGVPDLPLELWFAARLTSQPVDLYLDTLYSGFELIASGVTTVQHLRNNFPGGPSDIVDASSEIIRAYQDLGMRVSYSYNIRDQHQLGYFEDDELLRRLSGADLTAVRATLDKSRVSADEGLAAFDELTRRYETDPRVRIQLMPANLHWCSDDALSAIEDTSRRHDVPIHLHLAETIYQAEYAHRRTGRDAVSHLAELGLLTPRLTLGHAVWLTAEESDLVAEHGVSICHNCSSNLRLGDGIAPLNGWLARGINVGLGIDEAGINDDRDMLQEMRLALYLHRLPGLDREVSPSPADIFTMATSSGAKTTPFGESIGTLENGRAADFILADWSGLPLAGVEYPLDPLTLIVQRLRAEAVRSVVIGGELVYRDGRFLKVDQDQVFAEIQARGVGSADTTYHEMRQRSLALIPHLRALYEGYLRDDRDRRFRQARTRLMADG